MTQTAALSAFVVSLRSVGVLPLLAGVGDLHYDLAISDLLSVGTINGLLDNAVVLVILVIFLPTTKQ